MRVRRMASPLTAEKNVRQKLKKINEIIDRADELYHQNIRSEGARNLNTHDDDDDNNNKSRDADTANNNLTKLLSQRMKMKDGTTGAPIFILATCAVEGLDSYTVRDVFERLMRYGAWRVSLDDHGSYPRVAKTISPVALLPERQATAVSMSLQMLNATSGWALFWQKRFPRYGASSTVLPSSSRKIRLCIKQVIRRRGSRFSFMI